MGAKPSTAKATNIAESAINVSTLVSRNATMINQQTVQVDQNVIIYNVKGDVSVSFGGTTRVQVDVEGLQTSYFNGDFDNELVNTVSQIATAMAESMPPFSGETSAETTNMTSLITELVQEINEAYMTECTSTTTINQSAIIHDVEGDVSVTFEGDIFVDSTLNCSQNTSSVIAIQNKLMNVVEQAADSTTQSSLWSVIIACTLIIIVCALIIFVSYSSLVKLFLFVLAFIIVGVGLWVFSAWMLSAPPFEPEPYPPDPDYKEPDPADPPEGKTGFLLLAPGAATESPIEFNDGAELAAGTTLSIMCNVHNATMGNARFNVTLLRKSGDSWELAYGPRVLLATPTTTRIFTLFQTVVLTAGVYGVEFVNGEDDFLYVGALENRLKVSASRLMPLFTRVTTAQAPNFSIMSDSGGAGTFRLYFDNGLGFVYEYDGEGKPSMSGDYGPNLKTVTPPTFDFEKAAQHHKNEDMDHDGQYNYVDGKVTYYRVMFENTSKDNSTALIIIN